MPRGDGSTKVPVTEELHRDGPTLGRLTTLRLLSRLHAGDAEAVRAVSRALPSLAGLVEEATAALAGGGRLIYAGAGTSGRLAAADAAECPPTFGVAPSRVLALVAGGAAALGRAIEGAEDDREAALSAVRRARVGAGDLLVGVSASGRTPYVLAAVAEARARGARTALVTSNPAARGRAHRRVILDTGPERIAGSTRMKAGCAARMALGLLTSAAFVRLGAVRDGRMAALRATSAKLRARAVRNLSALLGVDAARARRLLLRAGWSVAEAMAQGRTHPRARGRARAGR
ncbi:MAG TPA: N-acetylmuramic acid 6-phosphate etherase [Anaeromyxobacter sp.]|nr:N-acetylmuramic acid 6-phosphate etherase [Anaeromyxobacter sp.]